MTIHGAQLLMSRPADLPGPAHERWAAIIESVTPTGCATLDRTVAMMAHVIRDRGVADPYAAVRIILSFRFGSDPGHDDAIERIATDLRHEAFE